MKKGMCLLSELEAEEYTKNQFQKVLTHEFGVGLQEDGTIYPYFIIQLPLKKDGDGGLWWQAHIEGTNSHFFIHVKLRTGEVVIPLCIVSPNHRKIAGVVAKTTYREKYNDRPASILIGNRLDELYPITFDAAPLCTSLVVSELFPLQDLLRFRSNHCPACRSIQGGTT